MNLEIQEKSDYCLNCKLKPCSIKGCPLNNNIPEFIKAVKEEVAVKEEKAVKTPKEKPAKQVEDKTVKSKKEKAEKKELSKADVKTLDTFNSALDEVTKAVKELKKAVKDTKKCVKSKFDFKAFNSLDVNLFSSKSSFVCSIAKF